MQLEIHDNRITSNIAIVEVYTSSKKWVEILSDGAFLLLHTSKFSLDINEICVEILVKSRKKIFKYRDKNYIVSIFPPIKDFR